ncbi:MAG: hypothetical protein WCC66_13195 [Rhizobiaceae bacterium]
METKSLADVIEKIKKAGKVDAALFAGAVAAMKAAFPNEDFAGAEHLIEQDPTEAVLSLVEEHLPNWTISLKGKAREADGEWTCTLRRSSSRDDDAVIGFGSGPTLSLAVLAAVLKASQLRAEP